MILQFMIGANMHYTQARYMDTNHQHEKAPHITADAARVNVVMSTSHHAPLSNVATDQTRHVRLPVNTSVILLRNSRVLDGCYDGQDRLEFRILCGKQVVGWSANSILDPSDVKTHNRGTEKTSYTSNIFLKGENCSLKIPVKIQTSKIIGFCNTA